MWPFGRSTTLRESLIFDGLTDHHSHILPGVDDGVRTMDESLKILSDYGRLGVKEVWLTPHIMEDVPNTTARLRERFVELSSAYQGPVKLHLAAENMLDALFEERLGQGDLLPMGENADHLLVETSYFNPPMDLYGLLDKVRSKGLFPLLAHPERYMYMGMPDYDKLKSMGVKLQMNLFSLFGFYGDTARRKSLKLLHGGYYDLTGTDIHRHSVLGRALRWKLKKADADKVKELGNRI